MILAKEKYDYRTWENVQETPSKKVKKAVNTKQQKKVQAGYLMIVLLAFVLGIIIAARYTQLNVAGYGLGKINKELSQLQKENQQLNVELSHLKSLDRIEAIATTKLGMIPQNRVQFVTLNTDHQATTQLAQTSPSAEQTGSAREKQSVLGAVAAMFGSQAEAGTRN